MPEQSSQKRRSHNSLIMRRQQLTSFSRAYITSSHSFISLEDRRITKYCLPKTNESPRNIVVLTFCRPLRLTPSLRPSQQSVVLYQLVRSGIYLIRLDTSLSTDIGSSPTRHEVPCVEPSIYWGLTPHGTFHDW